MVAAAASDPGNFWFKQATAHLGPFATTAMSVLLLSSIFASILAFHNAITRYLVALGQEGWLPAWLADIHPRLRSPHLASCVQTVTALVGIAAFAATRADPYAVVFAWMATFGALAVIALQVLVSASVVLYFHRAPGPRRVWATAVAPILSGAALFGVFVLLITNLPVLSGSDSTYLDILPALVVVLMLAGIVADRLRPTPASAVS